MKDYTYIYLGIPDIEKSPCNIMISPVAAKIKNNKKEKIGLKVWLSSIYPA
jgi:hypothetical protein